MRHFDVCGGNGDTRLNRPTLNAAQLGWRWLAACVVLEYLFVAAPATG